MVALVGCNIVPAFITPPAANLKVIPGGIGDVRPYFGDLRLAEGDDLSEAAFLLASCGCGDWRVLVQPHDGGAQQQFPIKFYNTTGDYDDPSDVTVYGADGEIPAEFSGILQQLPGQLDARMTKGDARYSVSALRGEAHTTVTACGMCHLGDDPIYPLPETHPKKYLTDPTVCLECHDAGG